MKTTLIVLLLMFGFTCNSTAHKEKIPLADCGTIIESPYLADDLVFSSEEKLTVALRFIQCKKSIHEKDITLVDLNSAVVILNSMYSQTNIDFVMIGFEIDTVVDPNLEMSDYRNKILNYKRSNSTNLPAIDIFIYPVDFNYYPGVALAIKSDGLAVQKKFITGNTLAHELGHCLGLHHTHQARGEGYEAGDFICDTPSTDNISGLIDGNCNYNKRPNDLSEEDMEIIIKNYMSYVNRDCRKEFTKDQIDRMRFNLAKEPMLRNTLIF